MHSVVYLYKYVLYLYGLIFLLSFTRCIALYYISVMDAVVTGVRRSDEQIYV